MQQDFHYYATYCAAILSGFSHEESQKLCYSAELVDHCSRTFLKRIQASGEAADAATTQLQLELMDASTSVVGLQDITRIWASFHFLPHDLYANPGKGSLLYKNKYRLICGTNGDLLKETVELAKKQGTIPAFGLAMHVLADTWAHRYFAGTPSLVINNTDYFFYELLSREDADGFDQRKVGFMHNPSSSDDLENGRYVNTVFQSSENAIMNLGHGRAGHLPDYSFIRYKYLPAWGNFREIVKDNPSDYYHAFCQMIYAMKYLRGTEETYEKERYDWDAAAPWKEEIAAIIEKRQPDACEDWKHLGEKLSGYSIEPFQLNQYENEYRNASGSEKKQTYLGQFIQAALMQKRMVTNRIYRSGNLLAGFSVQLEPDAGKSFFERLKIWKKGGASNE